MYRSDKTQTDSRIVVDVMLGDWSAGSAEALLRRLVSSPVFDGSVLILDEAMSGLWPVNPLTQSAIRLGAGALMVQGAGECLCCGFRSSLGDTLRQVFLDSLARRRSIPSRIVIVADAQNADIFRQTLRHAPFLSQRYVLRHVWRIDTPADHKT